MAKDRNLHVDLEPGWHEVTLTFNVRMKTKLTEPAMEFRVAAELALQLQSLVADSKSGKLDIKVDEVRKAVPQAREDLVGCTASNEVLSVQLTEIGEFS